jgi:hypothetical protein
MIVAVGKAERREDRHGANCAGPHWDYGDTLLNIPTVASITIAVTVYQMPDSQQPDPGAAAVPAAWSGSVSSKRAGETFPFGHRAGLRGQFTRGVARFRRHFAPRLR